MPDRDNERTTGEQFLAAFATRDFARLQACFHPEARFRALIPPGICEATDSAGATHHLRDWFGPADHLELLHSELDPVSDLLRVAYRLRVHDADGWQLFEQQAYCRLEDGKIAAMDVLCSGPRPDPGAVPGTTHS